MGAADGDSRSGTVRGLDDGEAAQFIWSTVAQELRRRHELQGQPISLFGTRLEGLALCSKSGAKLNEVMVRLLYQSRRADLEEKRWFHD
ncbi:hypothetical protein M6B38_383635 [Iris pallida]|uniref:Uncharacterized protein n=1 Tax=Iris pallida TaxID=29817 RepID=A0AAX6G4X8_IRIPA|nr:hypothetical protein M6B38_383635 [Iris pallida]